MTTPNAYCHRLEGHAGAHSAERRDLGAAYTVAAGLGAPNVCGEPTPSELERRTRLAREAIASDPTLGGLLDSPAVLLGEPEQLPAPAGEPTYLDVLREEISTLSDEAIEQRLEEIAESAAETEDPDWASSLRAIASAYREEQTRRSTDRGIEAIHSMPGEVVSDLSDEQLVDAIGEAAACSDPECSCKEAGAEARDELARRDREDPIVSGDLDDPSTWSRASEGDDVARASAYTNALVDSSYDEVAAELASLEQHEERVGGTGSAWRVDALRDELARREGERDAGVTIEGVSPPRYYSAETAGDRARGIDEAPIARDESDPDEDLEDADGAVAAAVAIARTYLTTEDEARANRVREELKRGATRRALERIDSHWLLPADERAAIHAAVAIAEAASTYVRRFDGRSSILSSEGDALYGELSAAVRAQS